MNYYIIENEIIPYEIEIDKALYSYEKFTDEQASFYEKYKCSLQEVLNMKLHEPYVPSLEEVRENKIQWFSQLAFNKREAIIPQYRIDNAIYGIYGEEEIVRIRRIIQDFRLEFYRLKGLCESATTINELNSIEDKYGEINNG